MAPDTADLLEAVSVVDLPLRVPFRGLVSREALLMRGPFGWTEFSPFVEYDDDEASRWLRAAIEFGWSDTPPQHRATIRVNATVPAIPADRVEEVLAGFHGARTAKVKVGAPGTSLADDVARLAEVRRLLGPEGCIRVDANGVWNLDEAEHAVHAFAPFDLEYVEQPCEAVDELTELRRRIAYLDISVAADEGLRKSDDLDTVELRESADLVIVKAAPLGGIRNALSLVERIGLPAVVSSALDTSIGLSMGAHLAAAMPKLEYDCGLGTAALLAADVTATPLLPRGGEIEVRRVEVDPDLLERWATKPERAAWWTDRLQRCHELIS